MRIFVYFLIILFLAVLSLLTIFNKGSVEITVWEGNIYEVPVIALILVSTLFGLLSALTVSAISGTRRYIEHWQTQRQEKKVRKIQELYAKGLDAFFARRYKEALELFTRIIESDPSHLNALLRLGDIHFDKGEFPRAKELYLRAKKIKPRNIEVLFSIANVFEADKVWLEALKYLDNIIAIDENNPKALFKKRELYEVTGKWEELLDVQQKILKIDLSPPEMQKEERNLMGFRFEMGNHYLEVGATDKAIKIFRSIIKKEESFVAAYLTLAESYLKNADNDEAERTLTKGYEATSSLVILARLEDHLISLGEPGRTIEIYQKAIQKSKNDQKLQFLFAKLYYRLEMIDYALETATAIDTSTFDSAELHALLGNIYERRSQLDKAVEELKKAVMVERPLMVPFCCSKCGYTSKDWAGRCPQCKLWDTLKLDLNGTCKA